MAAPTPVVSQAAAGTPPIPLLPNGQPVQGATWDPNALGGKGAWIADNNGQPRALSVDPATNKVTGNVDPVTGAALAPVKTNVPNAIQAALPANPAKAAGNALGLTNPTPPSPADSQDAQSARDFAAELRAKMNAPGQDTALIAPTPLDQTASNEARGVARSNLTDLQGVANGTTQTAADSLYQKGTDEAAARARGLAAAYSRTNPGAALRAGLAAGNEAQLAATSGAGILKGNEQAAARGQIGTFADAVRAADIDAASKNQANQTDVAKANQGADLKQQEVNNQRALGYGSLAAGETNAPLAAQIANQNNTVANNKANQEGMGALWGGLGSALKVPSDARTKTNVKPRSLADALAEKVHGVQYTYKPGEGDGGTHDGAMAGDIEKVTPGAIKKDARGMKMVDTGHLTMANTSAVAEIARRLRKLEKKKGRAA